jgi:hypothetical protein
MGGGSGRRTNEGGGTLQRRSVLNHVSHVRGELSPRLGYAPVRGAAPSRAVRALEVTESSVPDPAGARVEKSGWTRER